jgi:F-type H+-transporting ATPase subunit b
METEFTRIWDRALLVGILIGTFPAVMCAAEEDKWGALLVVGKFFNLALVIGVLVWMARKPLANFYASRAQAIREQLADAQKARIEAETKLSEIEARMKGLDAELKEIKAQAEKDAENEYQRLVAAAEQEAQKIIERARQEIDGMTRSAQLELKTHVAELAVGLAEEHIRAEITEDDRGRLFERFVSKLGGKA